MAVVQRVGAGADRTWTVLGSDWQVVGPVEEYFEFLRGNDNSPNTVKTYAHGLAAYWSFLEATGEDWASVSPSTLVTTPPH